jgi:auxin efflux carrier family protein
MASFSTSFIGALQGTISLLALLVVGYLTAVLRALDRPTVKRISLLCSKLFLPCLIVVQMAPELTKDNLSRLWIIPLWGCLSTSIAHLIGWMGQSMLKLPHWTIAAAGRPNSSSLPLLLLQSLKESGVLDELGSTGETSTKILSRAKSYLLLNIIVQQVITFEIGPFLFKLDKRDDAEAHTGGASDVLYSSTAYHGLPPVVQNPERVGLLQDSEGMAHGERETDYRAAMGAILDQADVKWPQQLVSLKRPANLVAKWMSPPLIAAVVALIIGVCNILP